MRSRPPHPSAHGYARLHRAWLHQLCWEYEQVNQGRLGGALRPPVIAVAERFPSRLGYWDRNTRTITITARHVLADPWEDVLTTLKHEVAHQYADEVLHATDETAHGPAFAHACRRIGVSSRARADPTAPAAEPGQVDRILQKVRKLLALAESHNVHEAELAMTMANRLLLQHNLELAAVQGHRDYGFRRIGPMLRGVLLPSKLVASILTEYFFVEAIWVAVFDARRGRSVRQLEILGTATNLELAHYVHDFLNGEAERLWRLAGPGLPVRGKRAQREYVAGVLLGFQAKLATERQGSAARGLVWVSDPGLSGYYRERHPRRCTLAPSRLGLTQAHAAGRADGERLLLRRGMGTTGAGGGLLGTGE